MEKRTSLLYKNSTSYGSRISYHVRTKVFDCFLQTMQPLANTSILDVGVTSDDVHEESNYFEKRYPYKNKITCVGTEDGSYLENKYPGIHYVPVISGEPLPFSNKSFDIVFSHAVIEHAGTTSQQEYLIRELLRVAAKFFITIPNRWFPIEPHAVVPFLHWLPHPVYRKIFTLIGRETWAQESNLHLLDQKSFLRLFPPSIRVQIEPIRLFGFVSNLISYGNSSINTRGAK